jgi:hypothetical protein
LMTNGTAVERHERTKRRTATGTVHRRNIVDLLNWREKARVVLR